MSILLTLLLAGCGPKDAPADDDGDGASTDVDCDDANPAVHPGAAETCDGVDQDCDGAVDDAPSDGQDWYADADADGFGVPPSMTACSQPAGTSATADDCDDAAPAAHPGAVETCDGIDDDCDGSVDEDDAVDVSVWYADTDGDGHGAADVWVVACAPPEGFAAGSDDCDDADPTVYTGAGEECDGVDDDCDGVIDDDPIYVPTWYRDGDSDGYGLDSTASVVCTPPAGYVAVGGDCDDRAALIHPGADETCDRLDDDCDGDVDEDAVDAPTFYVDTDGDGYGASGIASCTQPEGTVALGGDCDEADPAIHPDASELCDGIDQDCDGAVDDAPVDASTWYDDADGDSYGDDATGTASCTPIAGRISTGGDCDDGEPDVHPGVTEVCGNGRDDDCDGTPGGCAPSGVESATDADARIAYTSGSTASFGGAVAIGDATGDGLSDLVVGGIGLNDDRGGIAIYRNPSGDLDYADAWSTLEGDGYSNGLGMGIGFGDLTGDGQPDLVLGAFSDSHDAVGGGGVYVLATPLSAGTTIADAAATVRSTEDYDALGHTLATGDFTGDGQPDLVVGTYYGDHVYAFAGPVSGDVTTASAYATLSDTYGGMATTMGDLDGDGVADVVTAAVAGGWTGAVYVFYDLAPGAADLSSTADGYITGSASGAEFGSAVAAAGDLDGDGTSDLAVGNPYTDSPDRDAGSVDIFTHRIGTRETADANHDVRLLGPSHYEYFGFALAADGDLDGSGRNDLVVGAPQDPGTGGGPAVLVYYDIGAGTVGYEVTQPDWNDDLGGALATGDLNGDGADDLAVGAQGTAYGSYWACGAAYVFHGGGL